MTARGPRVPAWTRRRVVGLLALFPDAIAAQRRRTHPAERFRYLDPATEFVVERLTDPAYSSFLPPPHGRAIARRGGFLLFSSNRTGVFQVYRMEERGGECEQLTEAVALDPASLTLLAGEGGFCYFDGPVLHRVSLRRLRDRAVYRMPDGWQRRGFLGAASDRDEIVVVESRAGRSALRVIGAGSGRATTVLERSGLIEEPVFRPRRPEILYRYQGELWCTGRQGQPHFRLAAPPGQVRMAFWSPDGNAVLYLHQPAEKGRLSAIREYELATHSDRLLAQTSQFACFSHNRDASVFVGASANLASPHLLLLLRAARRELTLCEHRAGDPSRVHPVFSPDNRRVYFQSDREGNSAIYRMTVERLVEPSDS